MITFAKPQHLQKINDIYNQAVEDGLRTAHTTPVSIQERKNWFERHPAEQHPVFVYTDDRKVSGWISVSPYRSGREALNEVVEISYYVDYNSHGQGIATALMNHALQFCRNSGYRIAVAILVSDNKSSIALLEKFGFAEGGRIPDAIHYQNEFRDHLYMYKKLGQNS